MDDLSAGTFDFNLFNVEGGGDLDMLATNTRAGGLAIQPQVQGVRGVVTPFPISKWSYLLMILLLLLMGRYFTFIEPK